MNTPNVSTEEIEKFLEILDKMDNPTIRGVFEILLQKMKAQTIGYINVHGNHFEPAISPTETFMPLPSFGLSNTHIYNKFIPFPNGKCLAEMLHDPIEFHQWCIDNDIKQ